MSEQELIDWFWNKYNSCYTVIHSDYPNRFFLFYDEQFVRKIKVCKISDKPIKYPKEVKGVCLFEQDWKNQYFWYDYDKIYLFLKSNLSDKNQNINKFICSRLKEADKLSALTPHNYCINTIHWLKEADKLSALTPMREYFRPLMVLKEADKLSALTPEFNVSVTLHLLKEADKLSALTPGVTGAWKITSLKEADKLSALTPGSGNGINMTVLKEPLFKWVWTLFKWVWNDAERS